MQYAIIDIETTGGNALRDRITEIAVFIHDGNKIVDEFSSLINPECSIPPFISRLTGITDAMVEGAPKFYEVAKKIIQLTEKTIFVAHNASFDYSFIRREYKSLGFNFSKDYLCTVKLSRKLIPGFRSYSLGNLCSNLGIKVENRHRAGGDALATVKLLEILLQKDIDKNFISANIKNDYIDLKFPPGFDRSILDNIPEKTGVYYFYSEKKELIYIGKSNNIRKRILSHFRNKQNKKAIELRNEISDISFEVTGNELVALLLESEEIKKCQPSYNRAQRSTNHNFGLFVSEDDNGYLNFSVSKKNKNSEDAILTLSSVYEAENILDKLSEKYNLCKKLCGIYSISHACFQYSTKECFGACVGKESPENYNSRVKKAVKSLQYKFPNFFIVGEGRSQNEKSVVQVEQGKYLGFGFYDNENGSATLDALQNVIQSKSDNRDIHRIIRSFINRIPSDEIICY